MKPQTNIASACSSDPKSVLCDGNDVADKVRKVAIPLVLREVEHVVRENNSPERFVSTVRWDIIHPLLESEYAHVYPPGFYAGHAYYYVKGHFPCGSQGDFPARIPIVY